jgi:hypothetical protein
MFRLTKVKVAGLIAAGAVALGAVGAYAANSGSTTVTGTPSTLSVNGKTVYVLPNTTAPATETFKTYGDCVSWFATNKNVLLTGTFTVASGKTTVKKNAHGKTMSQVRSVCGDPQSYTSTKDGGSADAAEAPEAPEASDSGTPPSWAHSGNGRP